MCIRCYPVTQGTVIHADLPGHGRRTVWDFWAVFAEGIRDASLNTHRLVDWPLSSRAPGAFGWVEVVEMIFLVPVITNLDWRTLEGGARCVHWGEQLGKEGCHHMVFWSLPLQGQNMLSYLVELFKLLPMAFLLALPWVWVKIDPHSTGGVLLSMLPSCWQMYISSTGR